MRDTLSSRRPRILVFILLTYIASWTCWFLSPRVGGVGLYFRMFGVWRGISLATALLLLGNITPGLVALAMLRLTAGKSELIYFLSRLNPLRARPTLYLFALGVPPLILLLAALANLLTGGSNITLPQPWFWVRTLFFNLFAGPLWEELGWRGFLQPHLQTNRSTFIASLLVGVAWGPWHAPLQLRAYYATGDANPIMAFLVFCWIIVGLSAILGWQYETTSGSIFPCVVFHAAWNDTSQYFPDLAFHKDGIAPILWAGGVTWLLGLFLYLRLGRRLRDARNP
jgi:membrane protease YdiL (CAAX protease family)